VRAMVDQAVAEVEIHWQKDRQDGSDFSSVLTHSGVLRAPLGFS